jgi:hypothetical protein
MSIRKSLIMLWLVFTFSAQMWQVFGQTSVQTVTGCLSRGDRPGFYSIREEGTGFSIAVTGSGDLEKYSAGHKVRLTGSMAREADRDVFRVSNVEQLSTTCEPTFPLHLSMEGAREAVGRATFGVRGGIGFDPELIYVGAHAQLGPLVRSLWFRPSFEFGFGEVTKVASFNFDFAYFLPLTARGRGTDRADFWNIYMGAGPAAHLSHRSFEEANIDFGDWDFDGGLNIFMGLSKRSGFFAELRAGAYGPTKVKVMVGYTFRKK